MMNQHPPFPPPVSNRRQPQRRGAIGFNPTLNSRRTIQAKEPHPYKRIITRKCPHFYKFIGQRKGSKALQVVQGFRSDPPMFIRCRTCRKRKSRIQYCFTCKEVHCFKHMVEHLKSERHPFSYSPSSKMYICGKCGDYVLNLWDKPIQRQINYQIYSRNFSRLPPNEFQGLRGLINLGSTCFLNSIIQALNHNPFLRGYYLGISKEEESEGVGQCLRKLIMELNSGHTRPYNPHDFLYEMWNRCGDLAGYAQQDAHEFLMALLNQINGSKIVDFVFKGTLRSDIVCSHCKSRSVTYDPFTDISLPLKTQYIDHGSPMTPTPSHRRQIRQKWEEDRLLRSLFECLQKYTKNEALTEFLTCSKCCKKRVFTKQLTLKTLPLVIIFHLKRFEQGFQSRQRKSSKVSHFIQFPMEVDMFPYSSKFLIDMPPQMAEGDICTHKEIYTLFSVIQHTGSMESGHYTCYVKKGNSWFLCDDAATYFVKAQEIMDVNGYLLFYVKKKIHYS